MRSDWKSAPSRPGLPDEVVTRVFVELFKDLIILARAFVTSCLDYCDELSSRTTVIPKSSSVALKFRRQASSDASVYLGTH